MTLEGDREPLEGEVPSLCFDDEPGPRRSFRSERLALRSALVRAGFSPSNAAVVSWAELPWVDAERLSAALWARLEQVRRRGADYLAAAGDGSNEVRLAVAHALLLSYQNLADKLQEPRVAARFYRLRRPSEDLPPRLEDVASRVTDWLTPSGCVSSRLQAAKSLVDRGVQVPVAGAMAFLSCPWLDGVPVAPEFSEALRVRVIDSHRIGRADLSEAVRAVRELAVEHDAVDYVEACDVVLRGLDDVLSADQAEPPFESSGGTAGWHAVDAAELNEALSWFPTGLLVDDEGNVAELSESKEELLQPRVVYGSELPASLFDASADVWRRVTLNAYLSGASTLKDVLLYASTDAADSLLEIADAIPVDRLLPSRHFGFGLVEQVADFIAALDDRSRDIFIRRQLVDNPETLEELGESHGLTRDRARQLQKRAVEDFDSSVGLSVREASLTLRAGLPAVTTDGAFRSAVVRLVGDGPTDVTAWTAHALIQQSGYQLQPGWAIHESFQSTASDFGRVLDDHTSRYGLVDIDTLADAYPALQGVLLESLLELHGCVPFLGLRLRSDAKRNRVFAALTSIGRPATGEEVCRVAGLSPSDRYAMNLMSAEPGIERATKDTWGFEEWVSESYESIAKAIEKRIVEDGGATSVSGLLEDLPSKFVVSKTSVRAYLKTVNFEVSGGMVRLATERRSRHAPLEALENIEFLPDGSPVLRFPLFERYFDGYSVKIPPAFAEHLGVHLGESSRVGVQSPPGCPDVSIIWRPSSVGGPEMGRARESLQAIDAKPGQDVYVTASHGRLTISTKPPAVLHSGNQASTTQVVMSVRPVGAGAGSMNEAEASLDDVVERMMARRRL